MTVPVGYPDTQHSLEQIAIQTNTKLHKRSFVESRRQLHNISINQVKIMGKFEIVLDIV